MKYRVSVEKKRYILRFFELIKGKALTEEEKGLIFDKGLKKRPFDPAFNRFRRIKEIEINPQKIKVHFLDEEEPKYRELSVDKKIELPYVTSYIKYFSFLKSLSLVGLGIREIPFDIGDLKNLKELNLSYNEIETIPRSITGLTKLKKLILVGNKISRIPEEVGNLENLQILSIRENCLEGSYDPILGRLSRLKMRFI